MAGMVTEGHSGAAPSLQLVEAELAAVLGDSVGSAVRVPGYFLNATFMVDGEQGGYVLKCGESGPAVTAEAAALETARSLDLPCPQVLAVDAAGDRIGSPYLVMTRMPGRPIDPASPAWIDVGRCLRTLHEVPVVGFGWLGLTGDVRQGPFPAWRDHVLERAIRIGDAARAGLIPNELADNALAVIERHAEFFDCPTAHLLHGDIDTRHVLVDGNRLSAIIDWGDVAAGDPLFDLGFVARTAPAAVAALLRGYGPTGFSAEELGTRLAVYASVLTASAIVGQHDAGVPTGDWLQPATAELISRLSQLA